MTGGELGTVLPRPDDTSAEFWDGAAQSRLVVQRCTTCESFQHPPEPQCSGCGGHELGFEPVSGRARVRGFCVNRQEGSTPFSVPYTNLVVEIVEQSGLLLPSYLPGEPPDWVSLDVEVEVEFVRVSESISLPQFGLAKTAGGSS